MKSNEILSVLEYMEKEKGIDRETMITTISNAIRAAAQKGTTAGQDLKIDINAKTGEMKAWAMLEIVDSVADPQCQIHIEKARVYTEKPVLGDVIYKEIDPSYLGRIAAQTARQLIAQTIRRFEKERLYVDFEKNVGTIMSGVVRRKERHRDFVDLVVDLGKAEAILPSRECVYSEDYSPGDTIRCLLLKVEEMNRGPELILSRKHVDFVKRLFELEVSEIAEGVVTIEAISREPGLRTKIAVSSKDSHVDPVGACVGARGARVRAVVRELNGEKVDVIQYFEDPKQLLAEALKPAIPKNIQLDELRGVMSFTVSEEDFPVAVGRGRLNARLTSKLIGWKLEIGTQEGEAQPNFEARMRQAVVGLEGVAGMTQELAMKLVSMGLNSPEAFEGVTQEDLVSGGLTEQEASDALQKVAAFRDNKSSESPQEEAHPAAHEQNIQG